MRGLAPTVCCLVASVAVAEEPDAAAHWAFQPLAQAAVPADPAGIANHPIDRFITAKWREKELPIDRFTAADKRTLLRRVTLDLVGLPPTIDEIEGFLADDSPDAWERLVDRLLASPDYGERWGRHWLDVVRYADTSGNPPDFPVREAYRYRNWVIGAFRRDLPYDQFVREQIAGDLLGGDTEEQKQERTIATGYLAIHRRFFGSAEGKADHLEIEDVLNTLGRSLLGLSLSCARCHDHKFDPITTREYYALYGIFQSTRYPFPGAEGNGKPNLMVALGPGQEAYAAADAEAKNAEIHLGGEPGSAGDEVPRGSLSILGGQQLPADAAGSGRRELAEWLTEHHRNPLLARVMINRIWQHHFGRGIVETASDFGLRGTPPTHPELLDYLDGRLIEGGWSVKRMHRLVCSSATYRLPSVGMTNDQAPMTKQIPNPKSEIRNCEQLDPTNTLLWHFPRRRLDAEAIRDAMLAASGELDRTMGGEHPFPPQDQWGFTQHAPFQATYDTNRRSVYLVQQRSKRHPYLALFDGADPSASTGNRLPTTTPIQALFLMNDPFVHGQADALAARVIAAAPDTPRRLAQAFLLALSRPPSAEESRQFEQHVEQFREGLSRAGVPADKHETAAWASVARILLSSNEFLHVE
jgi:hypothetical protein